MAETPLTRSRDDRVLAGVCGGLAAHLGVSVVAVRIAVLVLSLLGGAGALLYAWLWITVPVQGETEGIVPLRRVLTRPAGDVGGAGVGGGGAVGGGSNSSAGSPGVAGARGAGAAASAANSQRGSARPAPSAPSVPPLADLKAVLASVSGSSASADRADPAAGSNGARRSRARWPIAELLLGACLLIAGVGLVLSQNGVRVNLEIILPGMAVLVGVGLTWWQIADRDRPDRNQVPRVLGALALVAVGVLMFFVTAQEPSVWTVIAAAVAVLAGVALAIAPWLLRINRELIAERAARARESERAEIAAHLHDSVLQTLALIQQRSEPGSEVARIARRQERELREWLFRTADGAPEADLQAVDTELRVHAAALENEHAVRFEIVAVGAGEGVIAPAAIVAAAREAMLNASRHAGGDVTVYLEVTPDRVMIDVTDRGPGVDLDGLPEGRMGVRESILGRMERAGGSARIVPGPGGSGTAVRLSLLRADATDSAGASGTGASGTAAGASGATEGAGAGGTGGVAGSENVDTKETA